MIPKIARAIQVLQDAIHPRTVEVVKIMNMTRHVPHSVRDTSVSVIRQPHYRSHRLCLHGRSTSGPLSSTFVAFLDEGDAGIADVSAISNLSMTFSTIAELKIPLSQLRSYVYPPYNAKSCILHGENIVAKLP